MEITLSTILSWMFVLAISFVAGRKAHECKRLRAELAKVKKYEHAANREGREVRELLEAGWVFSREIGYTFMHCGSSGTFDHTYFKAPDEDKPRPFREAVERQKELVKCRRLNVPLSDDEVLGWRELTEK